MRGRKPSVSVSYVLRKQEALNLPLLVPNSSFVHGMQLGSLMLSTGEKEEFKLTGNVSEEMW